MRDDEIGWPSFWTNLGVTHEIQHGCDALALSDPLGIFAQAVARGSEELFRPANGDIRGQVEHDLLG